VNPSSYYPIFFGYVDDPHIKTITGTITERSKLSLDCLSYAARVASDYITYDYYKLQSAISPLADSNAWSYRDMIESFLTYPDSTRDGTGLSGTGFTVTAANDPSGIDAIIDGSCNWSRQTLFEAIRTVCEHIGYDGYFPSFTDVSFTPTINLYPFNKTNAATISDPLIKEPEYEYGKLSDLFNIIFVWGGVDRGVPADGDRWTEWAAGTTKYDPAIWSAIRTDADTTVTNENNTVFSESLRANSKCLKVSTTGSTNDTLHIILTLADTEVGSIDALNRITAFTVSLKNFSSTSTYGRYTQFVLTDSSANVIWLMPRENNNQNNVSYERQYIINIGDGEAILTGTPSENIDHDKWFHHTGTTFDWENIIQFQINILNVNISSGATWGVYVDGLQFIGGYPIEPFRPYSATLNPPVKDATSINTYGIHPLHHQDTLLHSFEAAQTEGARLLANLKDPNPLLTFTKNSPETTQLFPSNVINSVYRIAGMIYDWNAKSRQCNVKYKCVGKLKPLPPVWTQQNELRFLVK